MLLQGSTIRIAHLPRASKMPSQANKISNTLTKSGKWLKRIKDMFYFVFHSNSTNYTFCILLQDWAQESWNRIFLKARQVSEKHCRSVRTRAASMVAKRAGDNPSTCWCVQNMFAEASQVIVKLITTVCHVSKNATSPLLLFDNH